MPKSIPFTDETRAQVEGAVLMIMSKAPALSGQCTTIMRAAAASSPVLAHRLSQVWADATRETDFTPEESMQVADVLALLMGRTQRVAISIDGHTSQLLDSLALDGESRPDTLRRVIQAASAGATNG